MQDNQHRKHIESVSQEAGKGQGWPLDSRDSLHQALVEQGEDEESIMVLAPVLEQLREWRAPTPTTHDTSMLVDYLTSRLRLPSPTQASEVRQVLRHQRSRTLFAAKLAQFVRVALSQVGLLRPSFWLASAAIVALGAVALLSGLSTYQSSLLRALGPLLAVLSVGSIMRSRQLGVLELELSCPISPLQLTLARMAVVLGYDIGLGLLLSLLLWVAQPMGGQLEGGLWALSLHWLGPLLLVAGAALMLSLKLPSIAAGAVAYAGWLSVLALALSEREGGFFTDILSNSETVMLGVGVTLLAVAAVKARAGVPVLLTRI